MKAVVCEQFGGPDKLVLKDLPDPKPGPGQVLIAIEACGLNFPETLIIENKYQLKAEPPFIPGGEIAGRIEELGAGVKDYKPGDLVMGMLTTGGYASKVCAPFSAIAPRPANFPASAAAAFTMAFGTAFHALKQRGALQAGEHLLVLGASGGVGSAAVQLGAAMGAVVIAAASTDEKLELARKNGAKHLINYSNQNLRQALKAATQGRGLDLVFDPVGGPMLEQALRSTAPNGRVLVVGFASGQIPSIAANLALVKEVSLIGVFWGAFYRRDPEASQTNFMELADMMDKGKIRPLVTQEFPLEQASLALQMIKDRKAMGKLVLVP